MDAARILLLARRRVGLTQRDLASRSRTPQSTIARVERGQISPTVETLERLLRACDQELESVPMAGDRDIDWDEIDDRLDMSPAERARHAALAGRSMLEFLASGTASAAEEPGFDPVAVVRTLRTRSVEFVVIGGFAAALRGSPIVTDDVDICYAQEESNRRRLADALVELGARLPGVEVAPPFVIEDELEPGDHSSFLTEAGRVDTIAKPNATKGYLDLLIDAEWLDLDECTVLVPSLDDLVRMKAEGAREGDWIALRGLRAVRKRVGVAYR